MNYIKFFTLLLLTVGITSCKKEPNFKLPEVGLYTTQSDIFPYVNFLKIRKENKQYHIEFYETKNGTKKCSLNVKGKATSHGIALDYTSEIDGATIIIRKTENGILAGPKGPEDPNVFFTFCNTTRTPSGLYKKMDTTSLETDEGFMEFTVDADKAEEVETFLRGKVYDRPGQIERMKKSDRRFQFYKIDLNGDGNEETFVRPMNNEYCGSGGCTYFILDSKNTIITKFTVTKAPFFVGKQAVNGWHNILVQSDSAYRNLIFKEGTYPPNPSMVPPTDILPSGHDAVIFSDDYPAKTYKF